MRVVYLILWTLLACSGSITTAYVGAHHPDTAKKIIALIDVLGVTKVSAYEKNRIYTISMLPIPYEQRDVLKNGTVFLGATREMVVLAIDQPKKVIRSKDNLETWVYYPQDESRPVLLHFSDDTLIASESAPPGQTI